MPSIPTWYRALIVEIQSRLSWNWRPVVPPKSNPNSITMPTRSAAPVNAMPSPRTSRSLRFGTSAMTIAPTAGRNVAMVIAEFSQVMRSPSLFLRLS